MQDFFFNLWHQQDCSYTFLVPVYIYIESNLYSYLHRRPLKGKVCKLCMVWELAQVLCVYIIRLIEGKWNH
jgi:hypothetical protein